MTFETLILLCGLAIGLLVGGTIIRDWLHRRRTIRQIEAGLRQIWE